MRATPAILLCMAAVASTDAAGEDTTLKGKVAASFAKQLSRQRVLLKTPSDTQSETSEDEVKTERTGTLKGGESTTDQLLKTERTASSTPPKTPKTRTEEFEYIEAKLERAKKHEERKKKKKAHHQEVADAALADTANTTETASTVPAVSYAETFAAAVSNEATPKLDKKKRTAGNVGGPTEETIEEALEEELQETGETLPGVTIDLLLSKQNSGAMISAGAAAVPVVCALLYAMM